MYMDSIQGRFLFYWTIFISDSRHEGSSDPLSEIHIEWDILPPVVGDELKNNIHPFCAGVLLHFWIPKRSEKDHYWIYFLFQFNLHTWLTATFCVSNWWHGDIVGSTLLGKTEATEIHIIPAFMMNHWNLVWKSTKFHHVNVCNRSSEWSMKTSRTGKGCLHYQKNQNIFTLSIKQWVSALSKEQSVTIMNPCWGMFYALYKPSL